MKTTIFLAVALCGGLQAQNIAFQRAGAMSVGGPVVTTSMMSPMVPAGGFMLPQVTGSPLSGTTARHSLQVLGDGTRIEKTDTTQITRDSAGRTRSEDDNTISIQDPVTGQSWLINKKRKTAVRMAALSKVAAGPVTLATPVAPPPGGSAIAVSTFFDGPQVVVRTNGDTEASGKPMRQPAEEDLGTQIVNGIPAKGVRTTITIAAGEIGNDRDIHVVNERWYSETLQMVIQTSNTDPRFGTTDFELSVTSQTEPDASLFQVPAGYTINEPRPR